MPGKITWSILDHSDEIGTFRMHIPDLDAANVDAYVDDGATGTLGQLRLAISALTLGNHLRRSVIATTIVDNAVIPADSSAQRERKAQVTYRDTVSGKRYTMEIPAFDMTGSESGTDILDLDHVEWAAFVALFEANCVSELGNAIEVVSAKHVGRAS